MDVEATATATLAVGLNLLLAANLQALGFTNPGRCTERLVAIAPVQIHGNLFP